MNPIVCGEDYEGLVEKCERESVVIFEGGHGMQRDKKAREVFVKFIKGFIGGGGSAGEAKTEMGSDDGALEDVFKVLKGIEG